MYVNNLLQIEQTCIYLLKTYQKQWCFKYECTRLSTCTYVNKQLVPKHLKIGTRTSWGLNILEPKHLSWCIKILEFKHNGALTFKILLHFAEEIFKSRWHLCRRSEAYGLFDRWATQQARTWSIDAAIEKKTFPTLVSFHAFIRVEDKIKQVSLAFALMLGERTKDYVSV